VPAVNSNQIQIDLASLARTVPPRNTVTDFAYGDPYEILALASLQIASLRAACWGDHNPQCKVPGANFEPISWSLYLLRSYGLAGGVKVSYIDAKTGKSNSKPILTTADGTLRFCSSLPVSPLAGPSAFIDSFPSMLLAVQDAAVTCNSRRGLEAPPAAPWKELKVGHASSHDRRL
jgi:hypothetical protein